MKLLKMQHIIYAPVPPQELLGMIKTVCGNQDFRSDDCSFHITSLNGLLGTKGFWGIRLPRTQLHAQLEASGSGTNLRVWISNTLTLTEIAVCVLIFALWVAERIWTFVNHIEGVFLPSWLLKTVFFGPIILLCLAAYCRQRSSQPSQLLDLVNKAIEICERRKVEGSPDPERCVATDDDNQVPALDTPQAQIH